MKIHNIYSLLIIGLLTFWIKDARAQNQSNWSDIRIDLKVVSPNIILKDTTQFNYIYSNKGFKLYDINSTELNLDHCILSHNKNFCCFVFNQPILTTDDSVKLSRFNNTFHKRSSNFSRNEWYLNFVEKDLKNSLDNYRSLKSALKKHTTPLPGKYTQAFNADHGFSYPIQLKKGPYKGIYNYCKVIVVAKQEAGFLMFYCLYNEEGKKNLKNHEQDLAQFIGFLKELYIQPPMPENAVIRVGRPK